MKPCISEATTMPLSFAEDIAAFAEAGCQAMEVWLTKLEQHLEQHSAADTQKLIADHAMTLAAASYQGGLLLTQGEARQTHIDHFRRRLDICRQFGIPLLVLVADLPPGVKPEALGRVVEALQQAAQWAAGFDMKLALEFRKTNSFCASLETALALVAQTHEDNLGVCLDLFHFWTGPSKPADLNLIDAGNVALVQVCDLSGVPREWAGDSDRILPGDGDIPVQDILGVIRQRGYTGYVSLELMNPNLWQLPAQQVLGLGGMALDRVINIG